jgi:SAM-dependent methyltransferase
MKSWVDYWDGDHPIYVNARHMALHYRGIARDLAALVPDGEARVLDYGCGEAQAADQLALACRKLTLSDAAPTIRTKLSTRFAQNRKIAVASPEEIAALPEGSFDLIVLHSIAQYIPKPDFARLISDLADKLSPGGRIVVGDILPPDLSALTDATALVRFGFEGGFLIAAVMGLVRTALSDYRKIRSALGLTHYDEADMLTILENAGLTARRLEHNPGHNQARMAFLGLKTAPMA